MVIPPERIGTPPSAILRSCVPPRLKNREWTANRFQWPKLLNAELRRRGESRRAGRRNSMATSHRKSHLASPLDPRDPDKGGRNRFLTCLGTNAQQETAGLPGCEF